PHARTPTSSAAPIATHPTGSAGSRTWRPRRGGAPASASAGVRSAILAVALLLAAPGNAARGPLLPGTTLRLGMPLADCEARGGLTPGPAAGDSTLVTRKGAMRFFGVESHALLSFRDSLLVEAEFSADSVAP